MSEAQMTANEAWERGWRPTPRLRWRHYHPAAHLPLLQRVQLHQHLSSSEPPPPVLEQMWEQQSVMMEPVWLQVEMVWL